MPSIQTASTPVTSFPNEFSSPYGNDEIVPLYSSVPLKSPVQGCLPCVVCGNSIVRNEVIADVSNSRFGSGGIGVKKISIAPRKPPKFYGPGGSYSKDPQDPSGYFRYLVLTDWDNCLMSTNAAIVDSFVADGITYTSYPWSDNSGLVDGHTVWEVNSDLVTATCVGATGNYVLAENNYSGLNYVGQVFPLSNLPYLGGCTDETGGPCCPSPAPTVPYTYLNEPGSVLCNVYSLS
jgi:hypothetical protein